MEDGKGERVGRWGKGWVGGKDGLGLKGEGGLRGKVGDGLRSCHAERSRSICTIIYEQMLRRCSA